jgi:hypothetical protein
MLRFDQRLLPPVYIYAPNTVSLAARIMLFKTISASGCGIDAYWVEVEVDVSSARMTDFTVVGLPDNAVKESRSGSSPRCGIVDLNFRMVRG